MNKFITIKDAAKILGVSKITLRNWDTSGKLQALRHPFNNYRVYKVEEIERVVELIEKSPGRIQEKKEAIRKLEVQHLDD
jgi:DNA (cytosine-5)-methyltransferase 1